MRLKPIIAITMGDPCGIGPEVILKGLLKPDLYRLCRPFVVGNFTSMTKAASRFTPSISVSRITRLSAARFQPGAVEVLDESQEDLSGLEFGKPSSGAAKAAFEAITVAATLALKNDVDGITTGPIHKEQMQRIGFAFPGHTEYLASLSGADRFGMMMIGSGMKIMLTTIHLPLREAVLLKKEAILDAIRLTQETLKEDFGISHPKIAVAGLNPHAGEEGIFGDEERLEVLPAVQSAQQEGIEASGPYPADTLFYKLRKKRFDAAVALYHDQALIPIKLLAFGKGVNITVGLPFVRTSVDHGTAYDIAGQGVADPGSFREALKLAAQMAKTRSAGLQKK